MFCLRTKYQKINSILAVPNRWTQYISIIIPTLYHICQKGITVVILLRKKELALVFKEIRKNIGYDIQISPIIALINIIKNEHLKKYQKDLIVITVTVARLIFVKNWKSNKQINIERYVEFSK